ncbi:MAG: PD-(D/E)XK nuclease family protein [Acidimicrobiales bacterium]
MSASTLASANPEWIAAFEEAKAAWASAVVPAPVPQHWHEGYAEASDARDRIQSDGGWIHGPRSLLGVLDLRRSEVHHSKVLAWFLDPSGGHRLRDRFLKRFLATIGLSDVTEADRATVQLEMPTVDPLSGRAGSVDIVVRIGDRAVLIENKIWSPETNDQLDRYSNAANAQATLVYLTPYGARPRRSQDPEGKWQILSWRTDVMPVLEALKCELADEGRFSAALTDYLQALKEEFR